MYVLLCMLCACACVRLRAHVCVRACVRPVPTPSPGPGGVRINFTGGNARPMVAAFGLRLKPTLTMSRTAWRPFRNPSRTLGLRAIGRPLVVGRDLRRRRSRGHDTESKVTGSPGRPQRLGCIGRFRADSRQLQSPYISRPTHCSICYIAAAVESSRCTGQIIWIAFLPDTSQLASVSIGENQRL